MHPQTLEREERRPPQRATQEAGVSQARTDPHASPVISGVTTVPREYRFGGPGVPTASPVVHGSVFSGVAAIFPTGKRLLLIIWPFLAIVLLLVLLGAESLEIHSAGRAYVEGESLWSKAQKEAVMHLLRYAH